MNSPDAMKWIKLRLVEWEGMLVFNYEDGLGQQVTAPFYDVVEISPENNRIPLHIDTRIYSYMRAVADAPPLIHPDSREPVALAFYVDVLLYFLKYNTTAAVLETPLKNYLAYLLGEQTPFQLVYLNSYLPARPPFALPFNIRFTDEQTELLLAEIKAAWWYKESREVQLYGLNIQRYTEDHREEYDVFVISFEYLLQHIEEAAPAKLDKGRLLIVDCGYRVTPSRIGRIESWELEKIPANCLFLCGESVVEKQQFINDFLYALFHDLPLHEAMRISLKSRPDDTLRAALFSSPDADQQLRISDAWKHIQSSISDYNRNFNTLGLNDFTANFPDVGKLILGAVKGDVQGPYHGLEGMTSGTSEGEGGGSDYARPGRWPEASFEDMKHVDMSFHAETSGLVVMSDLLARWDHYKRDMRQLRADLQDAVNDPVVFEHIHKHKGRKVEVTLDEQDDMLRFFSLNQEATLKHNGTYRLNVVIGQPRANSLMVGKIAPIDPLLPDPEDKKGHSIDVVVFPKDFTLNSPSLQTIYLPLLGGSEEAEFLLKAPAAGGVACLRIGVFHRNVLLQSFLLEAGMGENYKQHLSVTLDIANSEKFNNLDELKERALFIGVNGNPDSTHSIFFKKEEVAVEVSGLNQFNIKQAQETFCTLIQEIYGDAGNPKYDPDAPAGTPFKASFYEDIRKLARFGESYYNEFFEGTRTALGKKLKEFRELSDQDITIARHQMEFAFPWAAIYDYGAPAVRAGGADYPVCTGQPFDPVTHKEFYDENWKGCPHNPHYKCYCTSGFWGIRHRIEELLCTDAPVNAKVNLDFTANKNIILSKNFSNNYSTALDNAMMKLPASITEITYDKDLFKLLWDKQTRPLALIVLGHLETNTFTGEPAYPRIITFPQHTWPKNQGLIPEDKWIFQQLIQRKIITEDSWDEDPLPLVFLINCSSLMMHFNSLDSISRAFHNAGATAVIGTEGTIHASIGTRFLAEVLNDIYNNNKELGEAIQQFNKNMFASGAPVAFIFTCFGNSNIKLIK